MFEGVKVFKEENGLLIEYKQKEAVLNVEMRIGLQEKQKAAKTGELSKVEKQKVESYEKIIRMQTELNDNLQKLK